MYIYEMQLYIKRYQNLFFQRTISWSSTTRVIQKFHHPLLIKPARNIHISKFNDKINSIVIKQA